MTITNYTFFSPTGTEFPVSSNADAKLYTMLANMDLDTFRRKDWEEPVDTALNRQYTNTSLVVAGRYFELTGESAVLGSSITNYIHANIDLANTTKPVSISVETADNSNDTDINNRSGVIKRCFDIVTTNAMGVISSTIPNQASIIDNLSVNNFKNISDTDWIDITKSGAFTGTVKIKIVNNSIVFIRIDLKNNNALNYNVPVTMADLGDYRPSIDFEFTGQSRVVGKYVHSRIVITNTGSVRIIPGENLVANATTSINTSFPLN